MEELTIYQVLDLINQKVEYDGLDNSQLANKERDDVVTQRTVHNWIDKFNETTEEKIVARKIDQRNHCWKKEDIERLLEDEHVKKKLRHAFERNTVVLSEEYDIRMSVRQYRQRRRDQSEYVGNLIEEEIHDLAKSIIKKHVFLELELHRKLDIEKYCNIELLIQDHIDKEKLAELASKIVLDGSCKIEYDEKENVILYETEYGYSAISKEFLK